MYHAYAVSVKPTVYNRQDFTLLGLTNRDYGLQLRYTRSVIRVATGRNRHVIRH
jgi:hypothetical protein